MAEKKKVVRLGLELDKSDIKTITSQIDKLIKNENKMVLAIDGDSDTAIKNILRSTNSIKEELNQIGVLDNKILAIRKKTKKEQEQTNILMDKAISKAKELEKAEDSRIKNLSKNMQESLSSIDVDIAGNSDGSDDAISNQKKIRESISDELKKAAELEKQINSESKKNIDSYNKLNNSVESYKNKNKELLDMFSGENITKELDDAMGSLSGVMNTGDIEKQSQELKNVEKIYESTKKEVSSIYEIKKNINKEYAKQKSILDSLNMEQLDNFGISSGQSVIEIDDATINDVLDVKNKIELVKIDTKKWNEELKEVEQNYERIAKSANSLVLSTPSSNLTEDAYKSIDEYEKSLSRADEAMKSGTIEDKKKAVSDLDKNYNSLNNTISNFNDGQGKLGNLLDDNVKRIKDLVIGVYAADLAFRMFNRIIDDVKELDAALVEVAKVTDLAGEELKEYADEAFQVGEEVARTGTEILEAAGVFARSGEELGNTLALAKEAAVMFNVSDGMDSMTLAAETLTSVLKAYSLEAENARYVTDVINEVSNTSATSFDDLADAVKRSGAVYAQSNTSLEEFAALFTTSQEIMQNSEKVSTGLNTISMRLRGIQEAGGEAVEPIAKLEEDFQKIAGISILDQNNELKSTYDIITDLEGVWDSLTSTQQQYLAELSAGKRQASIFLSLMENGEKIDEVYQNAMDSANSASQEQERYLDSIEGKMHNLDSAIQQLSSNTADSGVVKSFIDMATVIVKITDFVGLLNIAIGGIFAYVSTKTKMSGLELMKNAFMSIQTSAKNIVQQQKLIEQGNGTFVLSTKGVNKELSKTVNEYATIKKRVDSVYGSEKDVLELKKKRASIVANGTAEEKKQLAAIDAQSKSQSMLNGLKSIGMGILAGAAMNLAMKGVQYLSDKWYEMTHQLEVATDELNKQQEIYEQQKSIVEELESLESRTLIQDAELAKAKQLLEVEEQILETKKLNLSKELKEDTKHLDSAKQALEEFERLNKVLKYTDEQMLKLSVGREFTGNFSASSLSDFTEEEMKQINEHIEGLSFEEIDNRIKIFRDNAIQSMTDITKDFDKFNEVVAETPAELLPTDWIDTLGGVTNAYNELNGASSKATENFQEAAQFLDNIGGDTASVSNIIQTLSDESSALATAWGDMASNGALSNSTVIEMLKLGGEYANLLQLENGQYVASQESLEALFEVKKRDAIMELEQKKLIMQAVLDYMKVELQAYESGTTLDSSRREQAKASAMSAINSVATYTAAFQQMIGESGSSAISAIQAQASDMLSAFDGIGNDTEADQYRVAIESLEGSIAGIDSTIGYLNSQTLPSFTGAASEASSSTGALSDSVDTLSESLSRAEEELSNMTDMYEQLKDVIVDKLNDEIELEKEKLDLLEEEQDRYEEMQDIAGEVFDAEINAIQLQIDALKEKKDAEDEILELQEKQLAAEKAKQAYLNSLSNKEVRVYDDATGWEYQNDISAVGDAREESNEADKDLSDFEYEKLVESQEEALEKEIEMIEERQKAWEEALDSINNEIRKHEDVQTFYNEFLNASIEEREAMLDEFQSSYEDDVYNQIQKTNENIENLEELKKAWEEALDIEPEILDNVAAQDFLAKFESASYAERKTMLSNFTSSWVSYYETQTTKVANLQRQVDLANQSAGSAAGSFNDLTTAASKSQEAVKEALEDFKGNSWGAPSTNSHQKYANGGVNDFGADGVVDWTGAWDNNKWVDGTKSKPEVILNNEQAANVLYKIANEPNVPNRIDNGSTQTNNNSKLEYITISNLNIQAKNGDSLDSLLAQAKSMARNKN